MNRNFCCNKNISIENSYTNLSLDFYTRDVISVARELLGKFLHRISNGIELIGKIVEVEAYNGIGDEASHTFNGKTKRNSVMFEQGGLLYVYFTYGMHFCCNVVTGKKGDGSAVLIRAIEPVCNFEQMLLNRFNKTTASDKDICNVANGPAKVCKALQIDKNDNGKSLLESEIFITSDCGNSPINICESRRIGIKKSTNLPWRFYIENNKFVSKK